MRLQYVELTATSQPASTHLSPHMLLPRSLSRPPPTPLNSALSLLFHPHLPATSLRFPTSCPVTVHQRLVTSRHPRTFQHNGSICSPHCMQRVLLKISPSQEHAITHARTHAQTPSCTHARTYTYAIIQACMNARARAHIWRTYGRAYVQGYPLTCTAAKRAVLAGEGNDGLATCILLDGPSVIGALVLYLRRHVHNIQSLRKVVGNVAKKYHQTRST